MNIQKKMLNTAEFLGLCVHVNAQRVQGDPINEVYYVNGIQTGVVLKDMQIKFGIGNNTELARVIDISKIELTSTPCIAAPNVVNAILYGNTTNAITEVMVRIFKQEIHAMIERDFKKRYPMCIVHIAACNGQTGWRVPNKLFGIAHGPLLGGANFHMGVIFHPHLELCMAHGFLQHASQKKHMTTH